MGVDIDIHRQNGERIFTESYRRHGAMSSSMLSQRAARPRGGKTYLPDTDTGGNFAA
jgi:hypothetical protein